MVIVYANTCMYIFKLYCFLHYDSTNLVDLWCVYRAHVILYELTNAAKATLNIVFMG